MAVIIIVLLVVPEFGNFYDGMGADLPLATRVLTSVSETLRETFLFIIVGGTAGATGFWGWLKQPGRRATIDRILLRVPAVGAIAVLLKD